MKYPCPAIGETTILFFIYASEQNGVCLPLLNNVFHVMRVLISNQLVYTLVGCGVGRISIAKQSIYFNYVLLLLSL